VEIQMQLQQISFFLADKEVQVCNAMGLCDRFRAKKLVHLKSLKESKTSLHFLESLAIYASLSQVLQM
jgi:hypothetical protein